GLISEFQPPVSNGTPERIVSAPDGTLWYTESTGMDVGRLTLNGTSAPSFETVATPGQQNFDLTVSPSGQVYITTREAGEDKLLILAPSACINSPFVRGP